MSEQQPRPLHAHQIELEKLYSKNQLVPRIRAEFQASQIDFAAYMEGKGIPIPFGFDLLVQMVLHKRADLPTMVGILYHHFKDAQLTADMLLQAAEADLVDWSPRARQFIVRFEISDQVQAELDCFQFPLPMVVRPDRLRSNQDTGYLLNKGSVLLRDNHHERDVCLDHLERVNKIRFVINHQVVNMVKNKWKNLDRRKPGEEQREFEKRKRAFEKYDRTAKTVMDTVFAHSDCFYLTHKYDKRGRSYCMGYHVNYQGNPWNKAVIEFADKEILE